MSDNYLFLEQLIIERIKSEVKGLKKVEGLSNLASLEGERQVVPAAYVIYLNDVVSSGDNHQGALKKVQTITQEWAVVLTVNPADADKTGKNARQQAGVLLAEILKAMTGWKPDGATTAFSRATGRAAPSYFDSYFYYPVAFQINFIFPRVTKWKNTP